MEDKKQLELEAQMEKAKQEAQKLDVAFDEVQKEMDEKGYGSMSYKEGDIITIPGTLFASFVNYSAEVKQVLTSLEKSFDMYKKTIEFMFNDNMQLTLRLMKQHVINCDNGNASTSEEIDAEDAKDKIKPVDA